MGIGLLWYGIASCYEYELLKNVFLGRENFGKVQTSQGSALGMWGEFLATLFPVSLLIVVSWISTPFKERFKEQKNFWLAYALIPAIFFSLFPYHVNTYLYLLTPLLAWTVTRVSAPTRTLRYFIITSVTLFLILSNLLLYRLFLGGWLSGLVAFLLCISFAVWAFAHWRWHTDWILGTSLVIVNLIRIGATEIGEWDLLPLRQTKIESIAYRIPAADEDIWHEFGLVSAALGRPVSRLKSNLEETLFLQRGGLVVLTDNQSSLPGVQCTPWRRLKRRLKFPFLKLLRDGLSIEDPNLHRTYQLCNLIK